MVAVILAGRHSREPVDPGRRRRAGQAIIAYIKKEYKLLIGRQTAEEIKLEIGSALRSAKRSKPRIRGRDLVTGLPKTIVLSYRRDTQGARGARAGDHRRHQGYARQDSTEPASDILDRGVMLAPAVVSLLRGCPQRLRNDTQMPVHLAESPLTCRGGRFRA